MFELSEKNVPNGIVVDLHTLAGRVIPYNDAVVNSMKGLRYERKNI